MLRYEGLDKNFRFLVVEVSKQVERAYRCLHEPDDLLIQHICNRDDYIDHLKNTIESKCFSYLQRYGNIDKPIVDRVRSLNTIAANLERIADHVVNVARQTGHLTDPTFLGRYELQPFFQEVSNALSVVVDAVSLSDTTKAMQICDSEVALDKLYEAKFARILAEMAGGGDPGNLVTSLFIFHYLERMGDCLLNIGEAIILSRMGERLKIRRYQSLRETLASSQGQEDPSDNVVLEGITGTRSGCQIGKVLEQDEKNRREREVIYKEGDREKIRREKEKIEEWQKIKPDLAPRVVSFNEHEDGATLLIEYSRRQLQRA
jgi:phosphate uptake regulator